MADINKVILVGRLTRDAEQAYTQSGFAIVKFSLAANRRRKQGEQWVDEVHFFDVAVFGRQGEAIVSYLTKGKQVAVEGQLRQDRWETQEGTKRSKVSIDANYVQLLGGSNREDSPTQGARFNRPDAEGAFSPSLNRSPQAKPTPTSPSQEAPPSSSFEDDIPF